MSQSNFKALLLAGIMLATPLAHAGLEQGILKAGEQLKAFFPYQSDDKNELSDEISIGK